MPKLGETAPPLFIGIDPGQSGGLAFLCGECVHLEPMPGTDRDIWEWVSGRTTGAFAVLEKVHAMPKQGVSSTFKFGVSYGLVRMALTAAGIPFEEVTPQVWQKAMGVTSKKGTDRTTHKNKLKSRAQQLFPDEKLTLSTCDALLLAEYCRRMRTSNVHTSQRRE